MRRIMFRVKRVVGSLSLVAMVLFAAYLTSDQCGSWFPLVGVIASFIGWYACKYY